MFNKVYILVFIIATLLIFPTSALPKEGVKEPKQVILVVDKLSLKDINGKTMPNILKLLNHSSVGLMNTNTLGPREPANTHMTIANGQRTTGGYWAGRFYHVSEYVYHFPIGFRTDYDGVLQKTFDLMKNHSLVVVELGDLSRLEEYTDVAPTILDFYGVKIPAEMSGRPAKSIRTNEGLEYLNNLNDRVVLTYVQRPPLLKTTAVLEIIAIAFSLLIIRYAKNSRWSNPREGDNSSSRYSYDIVFGSCFGSKN
ncbi:MAG: hypothetical protein M0Z31_01685 [Clostridia bacterium]|nr:hypothetical protein [Clostridia bacterium]